jgi:hypothetical protein
MAPMGCPETSVTTNQRCVLSQKSEGLKILYVLRYRTPTDGKKIRYCGGVYVDRRLLECDERFLWNVLNIRQTTWRHSNLHDMGLSLQKPIQNHSDLRHSYVYGRSGKHSNRRGLYSNQGAEEFVQTTPLIEGQTRNFQTRDNTLEVRNWRNTIYLNMRSSTLLRVFLSCRSKLFLRKETQVS